MPTNPCRAPRRTLHRDTRGLAMVEFALSMPLVLIIGLYGLETANFAVARLRVDQIAATTADNAGRVRDSINEGDVTEVMTGAKLIGQGLNFAPNGRVILSSVEPNGLTGSQAGHHIKWQRCTGALGTAPAYGTQGAGKTDGSVKKMGATGHEVFPAPGSVMMFVEVSYTYQPLVSEKLMGPTLMRSEAAFTVRERPTGDLIAEGIVSAC